MRAILATNNNLVPTPTPVPLDGGVTAITAGAEFTCAVLAGGGADCWGQNASGQLGNGSDAGANTPLPVAVLLSGATRISAGTNHACALIDGGTVDCWGDNTYGQLGNEDVAPSRGPPRSAGSRASRRWRAAGFTRARCWATAGSSAGDTTAWGRWETAPRFNGRCRCRFAERSRRSQGLAYRRGCVTFRPR